MWVEFAYVVSCARCVACGVSAVLAFSKRFAAGAFFICTFQLKTFSRVTLILAGVFGMVESTAGGGLFANPESSTSLRLVTLDETAQADLQKRASCCVHGTDGCGIPGKVHQHFGARE